MFPRMPQEAPFVGDLGGVGASFAIVLACIAFLIGVVLYAIGVIARGALIAGVDAVERGEKTSFGLAWSAGWQRAGTLIGISILPALPALLGGLFGLVGVAAAGNLGYTGEVGSSVATSLGGLFGLIACILVPIAIALGLLRTFANRAAMFEGMGVVDSYRRGFDVLMANLGSGLAIFVIQILVSIALGLLLIVPGMIVVLCCVLWPLIWLFQGFMSAFFSAVWTLAWRRWTGAELPKAVV
jgi:hypothetical protein